jgi:hypothetical protein
MHQSRVYKYIRLEGSSARRRGAAGREEVARRWRRRRRRRAAVVRLHSQADSIVLYSRANTRRTYRSPKPIYKLHCYERARLLATTLSLGLLSIGRHPSATSISSASFPVYVTAALPRAIRAPAEEASIGAVPGFDLRQLPPARPPAFLSGWGRE